MATKKTNHLLNIVVALVIVGGGYWLTIGDEIVAVTQYNPPQAPALSPEDAAAAAELAEYQSLRPTGSLMGICAQASRVAAAYLKAHDELHYARARKREVADCNKAGLLL